MHATALSSITDRDLQQRVYGMRQMERRFVVELLHHLAEVERRKLYFEMGHDSLFKLLHDGLGYSKSGAYRRMIAARLVGRYPVVETHLRDGTLNLTQLCAVHPILTDANVAEELDHAVGKSEDWLRAMVAGRQGKPVETSSVRVIQVAPPLALELTAGEVSAAGDQPTALEPLQPVAPIADELHLVKIVAGKAFMDDLEAVRDALSHTFADRDITEVVHECIKVTLEVVRKRREGTGRAPTRPSKDGTRHVPTELRRQVFERDGRRCAHVTDDGQRCNSTYQLEVHHLEPFATGGPATLDNLELRCHPHNQLHARQELGDRHIASAISRSRVRGSSRNQPGSSTTGSSRSQSHPSPSGSSRNQSHPSPSGSSRNQSHPSPSGSRWNPYPPPPTGSSRNQP
jgi:hypothetical protein